MSSEKRAPTESTLKVDPSIEIHKTLYPYLNMKDGGFSPYFGTNQSIINRLNQAISCIN
jgi:hypothetical protein